MNRSDVGRTVELVWVIAEGVSMETHDCITSCNCYTVLYQVPSPGEIRRRKSEFVK